MKKSFNKFLAVFVSFVMAVGMVPFSGFVADAATVVGDSSTVTTTYKQVEPSDLANGDKVLITYDGNVLVAKNSTTAGKSDTTIASDASEITNPPTGSVWNLVESSGKYFFEVTDVETGEMPASGANRLKVDDKGLRISDESSGFTLASNGRIYRQSSWPPYYGIAYENDFIGKAYYNSSLVGTPISNATKFTFYKKIDVAKLTINYQITDADGNTSTQKVAESVNSGTTVSFDDYFQSDDTTSIDDYTFEKMTYNSKDYTDNQVTVNGDAEITVTYKAAQKYNVTVNFYLDGNIEATETKTVKEGGSLTVTDNYTSNDFAKLTVNGTDLTKYTTTFTINQETTIDYYYTTPVGPTYPDPVQPEGDITGPDQPDYPKQGAVKINKDATGKDFANTGLADVELGVKGVPLKKGVDVVLVLDVSKSMNENNRLVDAKTAAKSFVNSVLGNNADGSDSNNRLALVTFSGDESKNSSTEGNEIKYSLKNYKSKANILSAIEGLTAESGTDYDYAFEAANQILDSVNSDNRQKFVVFMTDGAPSTFTNTSGKTYSWYDYNRENDFADAVMVDPYLKGAVTAKGKATVYSIGFGLSSSASNGFSSDEAKELVKNIATDGYNIDASDSTELNAAFTSIAGDIKKAGTNASVKDIIGAKYELSYESPIKVILHDVYTYSDYLAGSCTYKQIGTRKGTSQTVETVTFSTDGTQAYSDQIDSGNTNIFTNGVINAKTFTYTVATKTFEWRLGKISGDTTTGDISEQEITLNYSIYLTGSTEGKCSAGTYDTNESAVLSYTSYKDKNEPQTFRVPSLSWNAASVKVEYYLVNEEGKPINTAGDEVPPEYKVTVGNEVSVAINKGEDKEILATTYKPEGYELQYSDAKFKVNNAGLNTATIESSQDEAGDLSTLISGEAPYSDTKVSFGVLLKTDLQEDTVVLDYGKPVSIDVRENDGFKSAVLNSVSKTFDTTKTALNTGTSETIQSSDFAKSVTNKYGTLAVKNDKEVTYTPNKYMDGIDKYYYAVKGETTKNGQKVDAYKYSSVSIIPATSVYYEDNFGGAGTNNQTGGIYYDENLNVTVTQPSGEEQSNTNEKYGYDSSYDSDITDSDGSATAITGNGTNVAKFTFNGTGFDLVGRTSTDSAALIIRVYKGTDTTATPIKSTLLYTEYKDGDLYQIPVYNWDCSDYKDADGNAYEYGQYTVTVKVEKGATFYLDAVRIYNPVDPNSDDSLEAEEAYTKANEAYPEIQEIRNLILQNGQFNEDKTGVVYIDGNRDLADTDTNIDLYESEGPNNEVYLKQNQSIGFRLEGLSNVATIQIGAKAPNGPATLVAGSGTNDYTKQLNTATDMYYTLYNSDYQNNYVDINSNGSAYVVVTNTTGNILALTNVKLTYKNGAQNTALFMADEEVATYSRNVTLFRMRAAEPEVPELDLSISKAEFTSSSVKVNKDATMEVYTTKDVDSIIIKDADGNEVTPKSITSEVKDVVNGKTIKIFQITITPNKTGTQTYSLTSVGTDGSVLEDTATASIYVKKLTIFDKISSWFGF